MPDTNANTAPPATRNVLGHPATTCVALSLLTLALYWPVLNYGFINFDDNDYVYKNPLVLDGINARGLVEVWTAIVSAHWHPLTMLSLMADTELWNGAARGFHATNLLLHILNTLVLFLVLRAITGAHIRSALVALLFAIHPLHVEPVIWISSRKDMLSTLFWFASIGAYLSYVRSGKVSRLVAVIALMTLGMLAKSVLITLPFFLLLLDIWPLKRFDVTQWPSSDQWRNIRTIVLEKAILLPIVFLFIGISVVAQGSEDHVISLEDRGLGPRAANAAVAYGQYLVDTVWPAGLAVYYPMPIDGHPFWQIVTASTALIIISLLCVATLRSRPYLFVGWFWYIGTLVPVIGLLQLGEQSRADRYTYVPLVGIFIIVVWLGAELLNKKPAARLATLAITTAIIGILISVSWVQIGVWKNAKTLYEHALTVTEDNFVMHYNLGCAFHVRNDIAQAQRHFEAALDLLPYHPDSNNNLGTIFAGQGLLDIAMIHFNKVIEVEPKNVVALSNLAMALAESGRREEATEFARRVQDLDPQSPLLPGVWTRIQQIPDDAPQ